MRPFTFILAAASSETITDPFNVKVSFQGPNTGPCSLNSYITADNETWISATKVAGGKVQECHQVIDCPAGTLAQVKFLDELHTDYFLTSDNAINPYADVGRPDGGCVHDYLIVSTRDQSKVGKKKNSEVFCGHSNQDLDPDLFNWMKTYSSVVVIDWYTDDAIKNSFGYDTAYKLKVKCDAGCPRDICLDKYFVNKEWRKYEECAKWQLRFMKSIENKEKRKNRAIAARQRRDADDISPCPSIYKECDSVTMRSSQYKKCLKQNKKTMKKQWKLHKRSEESIEDVQGLTKSDFQELSYLRQKVMN